MNMQGLGTVSLCCSAGSAFEQIPPLFASWAEQKTRALPAPHHIATTTTYFTLPLSSPPIFSCSGCPSRVRSQVGTLVSASSRQQFPPARKVGILLSGRAPTGQPWCWDTVQEGRPNEGPAGMKVVGNATASSINNQGTTPKSWRSSTNRRRARCPSPVENALVPSKVEMIKQAQGPELAPALARDGFQHHHQHLGSTRAFFFDQQLWSPAEWRPTTRALLRPGGYASYAGGDPRSTSFESRIQEVRTPKEATNSGDGGDPLPFLLVLNWESPRRGSHEPAGTRPAGPQVHAANKIAALAAMPG